MPLVMTLFAAGEICDGADGSPFCESMGRSSSPRGKFGKVKKAARSFIVKLQAVGIDAVHGCEASGFLGLGLGWLSWLLLRFAGFVRVMTSAVGHDSVLRKW